MVIRSGHPKRETQVETKVFAIVSAVMSVMGMALGQREKRSIQVKTYEQPELTGYDPTMSI